MATQKTIIVENFYEVPEEDFPSIPMIVVYENPIDFEEKCFVARLCYLDRPSAYVIVRESYEEIKEALPPHMFALDRNYYDDPKIVATFI